MKNEIVFVLEPDVGRVTVEASQAPPAMARELHKDLGQKVIVNCARPAAVKTTPIKPPVKYAVEPISSGLGSSEIYLYRLYHYSTVDGPGRRSVVQVSGCSIRCPGCYVPETHERSNGFPTAISRVVREISSKRSEHDGVTILGGEPFDQLRAVAELVTKLKAQNLHITVYTGFTLEDLTARNNSQIDIILRTTDVLIDGPYRREATEKAGEYRGSENQRQIDNPL